MEKPKAVSKAPTDIAKQAQEMLAAMATARLRAQHLPEPQAALFKVKAEPPGGELERCHWETETAADRGAILRWASLTDREIGAWQTPSSKRRANDVREWIDLCARCADKITNDGSKASKETPDKPATNCASFHKVGRATLH